MTNRLFAILIAGLLSSGSSVSSQQGLQNVGSLVKNAKIIVVGLATSEQAPEDNGQITLRVDRVLKGSIKPGVTVSLNSDADIRCKADVVFPSSYGVWFLDSAQGESYSFSPSVPGQWCNQATPRFEIEEGKVNPQFSYGAESSPEDKLANELAGTFVSHEGDGPWIFIDNTFALEGASEEALTGIYKKLESSGASSVHMAGLLGLVRLGDADALNKVEEQLDQLTTKPLRSSAVVRGNRLPLRYGKKADEKRTYESALAEAIRYLENPSPATVSELGRLLLPKTPIEIRRAAAYSLQNAHTARAVEQLAPLLAESDEQLRAFAIGGIACFANGVPPIQSDAGSSGPDLMKPSQFKNRDTLEHFVMGLPTISQKEDFYLGFWQSWWTANAMSVSQDGIH